MSATPSSPFHDLAESGAQSSATSTPALATNDQHYNACPISVRHFDDAAGTSTSSTVLQQQQPAVPKRQDTINSVFGLARYAGPDGAASCFAENHSDIEDYHYYRLMGIKMPKDGAKGSFPGAPKDLYPQIRRSYDRMSMKCQAFEARSHTCSWSFSSSSVLFPSISAAFRMPTFLWRSQFPARSTQSLRVALL